MPVENPNNTEELNTEVNEGTEMENTEVEETEVEETETEEKDTDTEVEDTEVEDTEAEDTETEAETETETVEESEEAETEANETEDEETETFSVVAVKEWIQDNKEMVFGITGVVLLLAILGTVGILLLRKKSKSKVNTPVIEETDEVVVNGTKDQIVSISVGADQDIGARSNQQDNYCVCEEGTKGTLVVVADGMGGLENGAEVSGIVTYVLKEYFKQLANVEYPEIELMHMITSANTNVCRYIDSTGGKMSGSTLVAAYVREDKLYFATVGDSHIYLMRNGSLLQLNREHVYGAELDEEFIKGHISLNDALSHRERKSLTSYIGMKEIAHVDRNITPIHLCPGDKLLLASDGVFGTISDVEMERVMTASSAQRAAELLIHSVKEKNKPRQDNSTAVVVFYE